MVNCLTAGVTVSSNLSDIHPHCTFILSMFSHVKVLLVRLLRGFIELQIHMQIPEKDSSSRSDTWSLLVKGSHLRGTDMNCHVVCMQIH